jgi:class 3 adenylate cyclase
VTIGGESDDERGRRARLADLRQELLAPADAIAGYAEILSEEARRLHLREALPDIDRLSAAAVALQRIVQAFLDPQGPALPADRVRHDLRNPLNGIRGYGEMLLEDIDACGAAALREDIEHLLTESREFLARIDAIVDFTRVDPARTGAGTRHPLVQLPWPVADDERRLNIPGTVLVIDDNVSNRGLLTRRLSREGHRAIAIDSGLKALRVLESEEVDLILLDLMMPDLDGFQVLERLKADERFREIPVIMISGLHETESVIRCIEAGAEDYLPKPFNSVLLRARINASLERKRLHDRERQYLARIKAEKEKSETLLRNILPGQIISRLNNGEAVIADRVDEATVLFCDLVGFTRIASQMTALDLIHRLNSIFSEFDALTHTLGVEKIKTIGDAYMAVAGLPETRPDHAETAAELALGMLAALERVNATSPTRFRVRIGMHTGSLVAGVIGTHKFIYDVWGDTVNIASRLETGGAPGRVQVSEETRAKLMHCYEFEPRGPIKLRGRGRAVTWFLTGRKADAPVPLLTRTP